MALSPEAPSLSENAIVNSINLTITYAQKESEMLINRDIARGDSLGGVSFDYFLHFVSVKNRNTLLGSLSPSPA